MVTVQPLIRPLIAASLAFLGLLCLPSRAAELEDGPRTTFERKGATACASYVIDGSFALYHDRIFARQGPTRLPLLGLPAGSYKNVAGVRELVMGSSFKACATAPSPAADIEWIDQSCMALQGVCLPPRAFSIDAKGKATPVEGAKASTLFSESMKPLTAKPASDSWSFGFGLKK